MSKTEQPVYALTSKFDGVVRIVQISRDVWALTRMMKSLAKTYVCRKIGEDNYVETLHSFKSTPVNKCPDGYVMKMIPPISENHARQLSIYYSKHKPGYISVGYDVKTVGVYMIVSIDSVDDSIEIVNKNVSPKKISTNTCDSKFDMAAQRAWMESQPLIMERVAEIQKRRQAEIKHEESTLMESVRVVENTDHVHFEGSDIESDDKSDDKSDDESDDDSETESDDQYIQTVNLLRRAGSYDMQDDESSGSYEEPDNIVDFRGSDLRAKLIERVNTLKQKTI